MKKKLLLIFLCIVLIITLCIIPVKADQTAATYNYFENGIMLDVARKYYTVDEIKQYIDCLSGYDRTYIQLHFTDDENVGIECTYLDQNKDNATESNGIYTNPATGKAFLTYDQVTELMNYAESKNVEFIPEIDVPAHMYGFRELSAIKFGDEYTNNMFRGSGEEVTNIDIVQPESMSFIMNLYDEYTEFFSSCKHFCLGFDEYTYRIDEKIPFINTMDDYLQSKGFITRIWNDSITLDNMANLNKDVEILYWIRINDSYASMIDLANAGFNCINCNNYYLFFVPWINNTNQHDLDYTVNDIRENWTIDISNNTTVESLDNYDHMIGGMVSTWSENAASVNDDLLIYNQTARMFDEMYKKIYAYYTTVNAEHGSVSTKLYKIKQGEKIPVTWQPDDGYEFDSITIVDSNNSNIEFLEDNTFIMPESDVTVTVNFKPISVPEETPATPTENTIENTTTNTVENTIENVIENTVENTIENNTVVPSENITNTVENTTANEIINEVSNLVEENNTVELPVTGENSTKETSKLNPKTGDDFICAYIILFTMSVLSLTKLIVYIRSKKQN